MKVRKQLGSIQQRIDALERKGFDVWLWHDKPHRKTVMNVVINAGQELGKWSPKEDLVFSGVAHCHPSDMFDRKLGTILAFRRTLEEMRKYYGREELKRLVEA